MAENFWDDEEEHHPLGREGAIALIARVDKELADPNRPLDQYDLSALYLSIGVNHLVPTEEKVQLLGKELWLSTKREVKLIRVAHQLHCHCLNLEKRVFELEQKAQRGKRESKY